MLEHFLVPDFRHHGFERNHFALQVAVEAHDAEADRALTHRRIGSAAHRFRRGLDEVLQHVVEEAHADRGCFR